MAPVIDDSADRSDADQMVKVIVRHADYDRNAIRYPLFEMLESCDPGIEKGQRVLLKPNLLAPASPDRAILTHPAVVRAVAEYVLEKGAIPQISDSPAMGSFEKVLKESGIREALEGLPVEFKEFRDSVSVDVRAPFNVIELAEDALRADVVINLPKLKTHSQMLLTLGVKNLFGCVVGLRKPQWHMRAGVDREMFAMLLVRIYQAIKPRMTILDGILAMEGDGPGKGGRPKAIGVLMGSSDATALDVAVCKMLGIDPNSLFTNVAAGIAGIPAGEFEIDGSLPCVTDFRFPRMSALLFGPKCTHGLMRRHLIQRPVPDASQCRDCGDCLRYCPAGAITLEKRKISFDYDKCIRCYCCIEVCPHGALKAEEPYLGRLFSRIIRRSG